jgi:hypothetical protein
MFSSQNSQVSNAANYIEDVFSTYLYTGNGSTQTITNGIDLSTNGGLVWQKDRSQGTGYHHILQDTARGATNCLFTNLTNAQSQDSAGTGFVFNNNGFTIGSTNVKVNASGDNYVSWTFRKQPKFFDVVTYTGNATSGRAVAHGLGSVPGCIIVKRTDSAVSWQVYHRSLPTNGANGVYNLVLNDTGGQLDNGQFTVAADATNFYVGGFSGTNASGGSYVAYVFAHNAGGFGLTGTDNVISCGSYTSDGSGNATVNLGYEPQWVLVKAAGTTSDWFLWDTMRGLNMTNDSPLYPNTSAAESTSIADRLDPTATGFNMKGFVAFNTQFIYIAVRRGPMKMPTDATKVFAPQVYNGSASSPAFTGLSFPPDTAIQLYKTGGAAAEGQVFGSKLQGPLKLQASSTASEASEPDFIYFQNGFRNGSATTAYAAEMFRRAPSFHDVVCYTGTGSATTQTHNLGVAPEMMIVKIRNGADSWIVYHSALGATKYILLDGSGVAQTDSTMWNNTAPTASVFSLGSSPGTATNLSGSTYVAYLFATATGVSKVGSYTGTGTTQQINCGFTSGARFVLIKRTSTGGGDWYVWDTARGIVSGNDPYLLLNSTAAEVTTTDYIDTYSAGFEISSTAPVAINASGGTFIYLAIA